MRSITPLFTVIAFCSATLHARPLADFIGPSAPAPETVVIKQIDDHEVKLEFFRPAGNARHGRSPAILWIHGGAWVAGDTGVHTPHARYFASRGMFAANVAYRLASPGKVTVADCIADCRAAMRYLREHADELGIDPSRIAVAGDSAGGHLAAALGTLPDDDDGGSSRADAMLLYNPIVDMTEDDWIRYAVGGEALSNKKSARPSGPDEVALARSLSPVFHVKAGQSPAIILHGRADHVVKVSQAERFAEASRAVGSRCDLVIYEDNIGHAFVLAGYKYPEPVVVEAIRGGDRFLISLGWLDGEPTLVATKPAAAIEEPAPPQPIRPEVIPAAEIPGDQIVSSHILKTHPRSPRDILLEARLDEYLSDDLSVLEARLGKADGILALTDFIHITNGSELLAFVKANGYSSFLGPIGIRRWPAGRLELDVRITGKNGSTFTAVLHATGFHQGRG
jgi:acetyl esterase/lipase